MASPTFEGRLSSASPSPAPLAESRPVATFEAGSAAPERAERFREALARLGASVDRGEALVRRVTQAGVGAGLGAGELIALQAGIYRYSEAVDLVAKLVDRGASAARTVVQSNG